jgi:hypothetical protein
MYLNPVIIHYTLPSRRGKGAGAGIWLSSERFLYDSIYNTGKHKNSSTRIVEKWAVEEALERNQVVFYKPAGPRCTIFQ